MVEKAVIGIVGLGYVGLPLALEFGKKYSTHAFDISADKIESYRRGVDPSGELTNLEFLESKKVQFTSAPESLRHADFIIVAVPTPVDSAHVPDLNPLKKATICVAENMKRGAIVIFESTVYPGVTEEVCVPILEERSGFKWGVGFNVGYSPERVNPGDKSRQITDIVKVVSADNDRVLKLVSKLYGSIIKAGVFEAKSIQVAEAAKVIENTQRDVNIALMNELAIIFNRMDIDTLDVLNAAGTKWNFLPFRPGLVGGHCIGVDPYYLTYKAQMTGYHPEVILSGRRINDGMPAFIASEILKKLLRSGIQVNGARVNVLGLTFKEDCSDLRNSKVAELVSELRDYGFKVSVHDPVANANVAFEEYGISLTEWSALPMADVTVIAVSHGAYREMTTDDLLIKQKPRGLVVDVKSICPTKELMDRGVQVWRL